MDQFVTALQVLHLLYRRRWITCGYRELVSDLYKEQNFISWRYVQSNFIINHG